MNNIKNLYILSYTHLQKSKYKKYFSSVTEYKIIENTTKLKVHKELEELNKYKRSNFWKIDKFFEFKRIKDKKLFIGYFISECYTIKELQKYKELYKILCDEVIK